MRVVRVGSDAHEYARFARNQSSSCASRRFLLPDVPSSSQTRPDAFDDCSGDGASSGDGVDIWSAVAPEVNGRTTEAIALNRVPRYVSVGERAALLALRVAGTPYRWGGVTRERLRLLRPRAVGLRTAWSGLAAQLASPLEHRGASRSLADPGWRRPRLPRSGPCRPLRRQRPHGSLAVLRKVRRGRRPLEHELRVPSRRSSARHTRVVPVERYS